jgi:regulator of protease activity HflC (stomatin/prohibitin superfamily)
MNIALIVALIVVVLVLLLQMRIVPQAHAYVIERLGKYHETWNAGFHVMIPFLDRISAGCF